MAGMEPANIRDAVSLLLAEMRAGRLLDALTELDSLPREVREKRLAALTEAARLFEATKVTVRNSQSIRPG